MTITKWQINIFDTSGNSCVVNCMYCNIVGTSKNNSINELINFVSKVKQK